MCGFPFIIAKTLLKHIRYYCCLLRYDFFGCLSCLLIMCLKYRDSRSTRKWHYFPGAFGKQEASKLHRTNGRWVDIGTQWCPKMGRLGSQQDKSQKHYWRRTEFKYVRWRFLKWIRHQYLHRVPQNVLVYNWHVSFFISFVPSETEMDALQFLIIYFLKGLMTSWLWQVRHKSLLHWMTC